MVLSFYLSASFFLMSILTCGSSLKSKWHHGRLLCHFGRTVRFKVFFFLNWLFWPRLESPVCLTTYVKYSLADNMLVWKYQYRIDLGWDMYKSCWSVNHGRGRVLKIPSYLGTESGNSQPKPEEVKMVLYSRGVWNALFFIGWYWRTDVYKNGRSPALLWLLLW